ncbi:MAG: MoxR family ATPase, partial [Hydrococcus sp. RM1_1_31]|nr:MoxR family ATPase [Hydrococcus sp. RM1_1_31]
LESLQPIATVEQILSVRKVVQGIRVDEKIIDYLLTVVEKTRKHPDLMLGASPRSAVAWLQTSKAQAWLCDRDYVIPDDIKAVALPLLRHRLILKPEAQLDGLHIDAVVASILKQVAVPR